MRVDGLPLGTRGGLLVEHLFPADGDYKLNINGLAAAGYVRGMEYRHTLIVTIDGAKVFEGQIGGEEDIRAIDQQQASAVAAINGRFQNIPLKVTAGPHKIGVTFVARTFAESDEVLFSFRPGGGEERIQRVGEHRDPRPVHAGGPRATRRAVSASSSAVRRPRPKSSPARRRSCRRWRGARSVVRSPIRISSAPLSFYKSAPRETGDFDAGIQAALPAILASPKFLYRAERTPPGTAPGPVHRISVSIWRRACRSSCSVTPGR